ncbi:MAG: hypothetical protein SGILL_005064 [Bacillariaceae sp.]
MTDTTISTTNTVLSFSRRLPDSRLGKKHDSLASFEKAVTPLLSPVGATQRKSLSSKEYTLVVITEDREAVESDDSSSSSDGSKKSRQRILLGMKNRGFGQGMYNSFGGKFHEGETVEECACRELQEEANIRISVEKMARSKVGIQRYTFDKDPVEMIMHVFRIHLNEKQTVMGCEEITPQWFDSIEDTPLDNMFADDSLWLTTLLSSDTPLFINGSYHFQENCQETNTILHYYMDVAPKPSARYSLEQRLFHALRSSKVNSPSIKEFKESYAVCNAVRSMFTTRKIKRQIDVVVDVAGGHGALAALFLVCTSATKAVVVDPAEVGRGGVMKAWGEEFIGHHKELCFRNECLRTGLPTVLELALTSTTKDRVLVVACHACQHLSEEILDISCRYGVHVAVMPCCQKDHSPGSSWKAAGKNLSLPVGEVMDLLQCGKIMALGTHDVRMKVIDSKITPQNRLICCRALTEEEKSPSSEQQQRIDAAHSRLELAYSKAHQSGPRKHESVILSRMQTLLPSSPVWYLAVGFAAGAASASLMRRK